MAEPRGEREGNDCSRRTKAADQSGSSIPDNYGGIVDPMAAVNQRRIGRGRHGLAGFAVACLLGLLWPAAASAHALLISANPQSGQTLGTGPGVVVLEFSEPLNPRLSSASVTDPTGRRWSGQVSGSQEMRSGIRESQSVRRVGWPEACVRNQEVGWSCTSSHQVVAVWVRSQARA